MKNSKDWCSLLFTFEKIHDNFVFKNESEKGKICPLKFHAVILLR